jgi:hypothetical protein
LEGLGVDGMIISKESARRGMGHGPFWMR